MMEHSVASFQRAKGSVTLHLWTEGKRLRKTDKQVKNIWLYKNFKLIDIFSLLAKILATSQNKGNVCDHQ